MGKTVLASKFSEWEGLDHISEVVHQMHCIYREISKDDFGIDGEIEIVIEKSDGGYETTGGIIKVQAKSGRSYLKQDTDTHCAVAVRKEDLELWNSANYPVIFIIYHPDDDVLYWKDIKTYIKTTSRVFQPPLRVQFDKRKDRFDMSCYNALCELAAISPPPVFFQQREKLFSNLLHVKRAPRIITYANTQHITGYREIRDQVQGFIPPFYVKESKLYTLADLRDPQCVLKAFCDQATIRDMIITEYLDDEIFVRDYIFLLNQLLKSHLYRCGLHYSQEYKRFYFPRPNETSPEFKRNWTNVRTKSDASRIVTKYYKYGREEYWRHLAAQIAFKRIGQGLNDFYLQVLPKYFFTRDGKTPCDNTKVGAYTTKIKAVERNMHVLNHVLFWIDVLAQNEAELNLQLHYKTILTIDKEPVVGIAPFAIISDPATYNETPVQSVQHTLPWSFEATGDETDDDDYI